jgi:2-polyprenyl-3-methyl-5-hydroxy-6-metoxy-1,4-benzoquinol methylase
MTDNARTDLLRYYTEADESSRVGSGWFQLEQARTQELILRHLPPPPASVLDVGGGAGAYALWLAERGYRVHLIDSVTAILNKRAQPQPGNRNIRWLRPPWETRARLTRRIRPPMRSCCWGPCIT